MKKPKFAFLAILVMIALSCELFYTGGDSSEPEEKTEKEEEKTEKEEEKTEKEEEKSKEYWGTWIRMDTGDEYYFDATKELTNYTLDGESILKIGSIVYFRKNGKNRDFSMKVAGFSDSRALRAISIGKQGISGRRENQKNSEDGETVVSDAEGKLAFTGAVSGDTQTITVAATTSVSVTPSYNGEDLGTIPIVESGTYGFKTTYSIDSDEQGFCFGNYYKTYELTLNLKNIGDTMCETSIYEVSCDDKKLEFVSGSKRANFSSIEKDCSKVITFKVRYAELTNEYVDVPIKISIQDSLYYRTWEDSITLRFYRSLIDLKVSSRNFNYNKYDSSSKDNRLKGFLIYPDGRSRRFTVGAGYTSEVSIPWSESDYYLVFSGATADTEMGYSFGFPAKTELANLNGVWEIEEINSFEPNNDTSSAHHVYDLTKSVKSYLKSGDIDFYKINCKDVNLSFRPVYCTQYATKAYENSNDDNYVTPGESHYLDVELYNKSDASISGVSVKLSSSSNYITVIQDSGTIGDIESHRYYSLTDKNGGNRSSADSSYGWYGIDKCEIMRNYTDVFKIKVASDCPPDTQQPLTLTFTDSRGNTWTDIVNINVEGTKADIALVYNSSSRTKYKVREYENGNSDNKVNAGESLYLDVNAFNRGESTAFGITAKVSSTSNYVTLIRDSYTIGDMRAKYYYSLTSSSYYESGCSLMSSPYDTNAFKFSVASSCPSGTELPFTVTFTDSSGNEWTDTLTIPVQ